MKQKYFLMYAYQMNMIIFSYPVFGARLDGKKPLYLVFGGRQDRR